MDSCLKSVYGISATKGFKVNDALEITGNDSANIGLYVLERSYDYQLWESDLSQDVPSDSYLGAGTVTRPLGLVVMITSYKTSKEQEIKPVKIIINYVK